MTKQKHNRYSTEREENFLRKFVRRIAELSSTIMECLSVIRDGILRVLGINAELSRNSSLPHVYGDGDAPASQHSNHDEERLIECERNRSLADPNPVRFRYTKSHTLPNAETYRNSPVLVLRNDEVIRDIFDEQADFCPLIKSASGYDNGLNDSLSNDQHLLSQYQYSNRGFEGEECNGNLPENKNGKNVAFQYMKDAVSKTQQAIQRRPNSKVLDNINAYAQKLYQREKEIIAEQTEAGTNTDTSRRSEIVDTTETNEESKRKEHLETSLLHQPSLNSNGLAQSQSIRNINIGTDSNMNSTAKKEQAEQNQTTVMDKPDVKTISPDNQRALQQSPMETERREARRMKLINVSREILDMWESFYKRKKTDPYVTRDEMKWQRLLRNFIERFREESNGSEGDQAILKRIIEASARFQRLVDADPRNGTIAARQRYTERLKYLEEEDDDDEDETDNEITNTDEADKMINSSASHCQKKPKASRLPLPVFGHNSRTAPVFTAKSKNSNNLYVKENNSNEVKPSKKSEQVISINGATSNSKEQKPDSKPNVGGNSKSLMQSARIDTPVPVQQNNTFQKVPAAIAQSWKALIAPQSPKSKHVGQQKAASSAEELNRHKLTPRRRLIPENLGEKMPSNNGTLPDISEGEEKEQTSEKTPEQNKIGEVLGKIGNGSQDMPQNMRMKFVFSRGPNRNVDKPFRGDLEGHGDVDDQPRNDKENSAGKKKKAVFSKVCETVKDFRKAIHKQQHHKDHEGRSSDVGDSEEQVAAGECSPQTSPTGGETCLPDDCCPTIPKTQKNKSTHTRTEKVDKTHIKDEKDRHSFTSQQNDEHPSGGGEPGNRDRTSCAGATGSGGPGGDRKSKQAGETGKPLQQKITEYLTSHCGKIIMFIERPTALQYADPKYPDLRQTSIQLLQQHIVKKFGTEMRQELRKAEEFIIDIDPPQNKKPKMAGVDSAKQRDIKQEPGQLEKSVNSIKQTPDDDLNETRARPKTKETPCEPRTEDAAFVSKQQEADDNQLEAANGEDLMHPQQTSTPKKKHRKNKVSKAELQTEDSLSKQNGDMIPRAQSSALEKPPTGKMLADSSAESNIYGLNGMAGADDEAVDEGIENDSFGFMDNSLVTSGLETTGDEESEHWRSLDVRVENASACEVPYTEYLETNNTLDYSCMTVMPGHGDRPNKKKLKEVIKEKKKTKGTPNKHLGTPVKSTHTNYVSYEDSFDMDTEELDCSKAEEEVAKEEDEGEKKEPIEEVIDYEKRLTVDDREYNLVPEEIIRKEDSKLKDLEDMYSVVSADKGKKDKQKKKKDKRKDKKQISLFDIQNNTF